MDTTAVTNALSSGSKLLDVLAPYLLSGLIIPTVNWLKRFDIFLSYQFQEFVLWLVACFILRAVFNPAMEIEQLVLWALQMLGGSSLLFGTGQTINAIRKATNGDTP